MTYIEGIPFEYKLDFVSITNGTIYDSQGNSSSKTFYTPINIEFDNTNRISNWFF